MTEAELKAIEERAEKATPGPWYWNSYSRIEALVPKGHGLDRADDDEPGIGFIARVYDFERFDGHGDQLHSGYDGEPSSNARFIAASRTDIPALLAHIRAVEAERDAAIQTLNDWQANAAANEQAALDEAEWLWEREQDNPR